MSPPIEYPTDHSPPAKAAIQSTSTASSLDKPEILELAGSPRSQSTSTKGPTARRLPPRKRRPARTLGDQATVHSHNTSVSSLHPRSDRSSNGSTLPVLPGPSPSVRPVSLPPMKADVTPSNSNIPSLSPHHSAISTPISKSSSVNSALNWDVSISNKPLLTSPSTSSKPAPYPPGFQPKGVYRVLTDDFLSVRRMKREGAGESEGGMKRVERTKLERRLEKLINLHFPLQPDSKEARDGTLLEKTRPGINGHENRRASSIFDFQTLKNVNFNDASGLWKGVVSGALHDTTKTEIRGWHLIISR